MKKDGQHLEFLVSQYLDATLDPAHRSLMEQQLAASVEARALLKEHREIQDVLDEWGSRIPLIDWNAFEAKLAERLAHEVPAGERALRFRRWTRPLAVAAALLAAGMVGYGWHAWTTGGPGIPVPPPLTQAEPRHSVLIADAPVSNGSVSQVSFPDAPRTPAEQPVVQVDKPGEGPNPKPLAVSAKPTTGSVTASSTTRPDVTTDTLH